MLQLMNFRPVIYNYKSNEHGCLTAVLIKSYPMGTIFSYIGEAEEIGIWHDKSMRSDILMKSCIFTVFI